MISCDGLRWIDAVHVYITYKYVGYATRLVRKDLYQKDHGQPGYPAAVIGHTNRLLDKDSLD